jgi:hypothetical protein
MASNKQHDNRGIGAHDEEQLRRLGRATHPTRRHAAPAREHRTTEAVGPGATRPAALGNTVESTDGVNVTHRNR